jgi:hypothetical protein
MSPRHALSALTVLLATAGSLQSATFQITPTLVGAYDPVLFNPIPNFDHTTYSGPPVVLQVDFRLNYEGSEGTFGAIVFDIELRGLSRLVVDGFQVGWQSNNPPSVDYGMPPRPNPPPFANNGDFGIFNDLKYITIGIASGIPTTAHDPRLTIGQGATVGGLDLDLLGSLYLDWDGQTPAEVEVLIREAGYRRPSDGLLFVDPNPTLIGNTLHIRSPPAAIPEPGTLGMVSLAALLWACVAGHKLRRFKCVHKANFGEAT